MRERKHSANGVGLLEKLTVEDKKEEEKTNGSSEEVKEETEKVIGKATPEKAEVDSEKK
nr:Ran-binding protein 1-b-like protein [Tanacetum cinerariifolium]